MTDITPVQSIEIDDPKLRKIALRICREAELAIEKVAANARDPRRFPLSSDERSLERVLMSRFVTLHPARKEAAGALALARLGAPANVRARHYGELARIDLSAGTAVDAQARALGWPAELRIAPAMAPQQPIAAAALGLPATVSRLELRLHQVKCIDETNGLFGSERGEDEIKLGGTSVDETGDTKKIAAFLVSSDFDDGDRKVYTPPRQFTWFNLKEGRGFPKTYHVTFVLAEADMGGIGDFLNGLLQKLQSMIEEALAPDVGIKVANDAIAKVVHFVVDRIFGLIRNVWSDDLFEPVTASVHIASLNQRFAGGKTDSPEFVARFKGHGGEYVLVYDWRLLP